MTSTQKLLVVTSATGGQGSSIVRYILTHSSNLYTVRAVTRNPESSKARALAALGAEVVQGDFDDEDSIRQALAGVQILFHNTDFWATMSDEAEAAQSLTVAKVAAAEPNLEHVVLSTLSDPSTLFQGKYKHNLPYNGKFKAESMIKKEYPELWAKTTRLLVALYHSNWFLPPFSPVKTDSGQLELQNPYSPSSRIPSASPDDTGVVVDAIIRGEQKYHGRTVSIWSEWISDEEKLKVWGHVLGVKAAFKQVTPIEYQQRLESIGFPPYLAQGCLELLSMLGEGVNYVTGGEIIDARTIVDPSYHFKTWEEYVKEVDWTSIL